MSLKDRLTKKTGDLVPTAAVKAEPTTGTGGPRTAPGQMLAFRTAMRENNGRVSELEEQLKAFEGGVPAKLIDPKMIRPSRWANRHESSFSDQDFAELKALIAEAGGNTQPIKVRPVGDPSDAYEIVFGHRRHRACLELELPVLAMVDAGLTEQQQFVQMDQENRARKNLSAWEQGVWYKKALTEGLWPSQNAMAKACGLSQGNISTALTVASLPPEIVEAFPSPHDIQFRVAKKLAAALKEDGGTVLKRARKMALEEGRTAGSVLSFLLGNPVTGLKGQQPASAEELSIEKEGDLVSVRVHAPGLSAADIAQLKAMIALFVERHKAGLRGHQE